MRYFRGLAAALIALAVVLSPNAWSHSHDALALSAIVSQHLTETDNHGHAHVDDAEIEHHAFEAHVHNPNDHDHIVVFLPPPPPQNDPPLIARAWMIARAQAEQLTSYRQDRPPSA